jgi:hypothetical protein
VPTTFLPGQFRHARVPRKGSSPKRSASLLPERLLCVHEVAGHFYSSPQRLRSSWAWASSARAAADIAAAHKPLTFTTAHNWSSTKEVFMSAVLRPIDLSPGGSPPPLFSVIDQALGPCDDDINLRLQAELKAAFHRRCNKLGKTMAERMRELMALDALGEEHVRSLMLKHCAVIGTSAGHPAPTPALAAVPTSAQADAKPQASEA